MEREGGSRGRHPAAPALITEIHMPKLGETVVDGVIVRWLKQPGDRVELDEPLVEVDSDKVSAEIPSPTAGILQKIIAEEGAAVPVGAPICLIATDQAAESSTDAAVESPKETVVPPNDTIGVTTSSQAPAAARRKGEEHAFSPSVRRLAQEHNINPADLVGTGIGGRVTKKDMLKAIEARSGKGDASQALRTIFGEDEVVPISQMRRRIAERMVQSKQTVPHAWTMVEVDVTNLVAWRESIKDEFRRREGVNLTYFPFVIKAAVEALKEFPIMNSMWQDDKIVIRRQINIGIAVDLDDGLIVPVIKNADQLSIAGIAKAVADLASRARSGNLKPDEVQGGTFTINNTGAFGSIQSAPIINYPQAAILSMETITKRPVVINDAIAIRSMMNLCVSLDHRVLDGAVCGRFLRSVKQRLESYNKDMPLY